MIATGKTSATIALASFAMNVFLVFYLKLIIDLNIKINESSFIINILLRY